MQAIFETLFDIVYLAVVITLGIKMIRGAGDRKQIRLFGAMAVVLGCGDAFHLVPRAVGLWTVGLDHFAAPLGFGMLVTSITMTVFYVILYHVWRMRYQVEGQKGLTWLVYLLAAARILLCLMPQNRFLSPDAPLSWGIYRNIPFALLGLLMIILFYKKAKEASDRGFRFMWLAILLSFGFYAPVVLFSHSFPPVGALMIPKTCAYVWIVWMGYGEMNKKRDEGGK